ncbi:MAG: glycosyltransferase family 2 protein, partial [Thermoanaerobaculia bacterium]|nr:glycosyltransferase family 2 protein [Thermoanaerobaculia bacterium]
VIVDDGSTDGSGKIARATGARVVALDSNSGYGAALKAGITASDSEWVAIIDGDDTYPAEAIPHLAALAADADMVVGARSPDDRSIPLVRRPAKWILGRLANFLTNRRIPDLNSGLRLMRRSVLKDFLHLMPNGFSFTTTVTLAFLCTDKRVIYEPITCRERRGNSKIRPFHFFDFLVLLARTIVVFNPLRVFLPLGFLLFSAGLAKLSWDLTSRNVSDGAVMTILAALIVWSVGLLADTTSRLHLRPPAP